MLNIQGLKLRIEESPDQLIAAVCKKLKISEALIVGYEIAKESIDARNKSNIFRVFNLNITVPTGKEEFVLKQAARAGIKAGKALEDSFVFPIVERKFIHRPVVCGFGPCGIFAALVFARLGLNPIVIERGASMEERVEAVKEFWETGKLDETTNVQFGEGGAGTFSDAKLTTGTGNPVNRYILSEFVEAGAPVDILYKNKPHVGTDVIRKVVVKLREKIQMLGGEVRFQSMMSDLKYADGRLCGIKVNDAYFLEADTVILALGHSARDSFRMLYKNGIGMAQKQFSMGVRVEHLQSEINKSQYGENFQSFNIPPAEYKLSFQTSSGRGVYTFCMCPGGYVVASASKNGELVTNGMSYHSRNSKNANSAVLVDVRPSDYASSHPLAGLEFQEKYERLAFEAGGKNFRAPAEYLRDFLGVSYSKGDVHNRIIPSYRPGVTWTKLDACLPPFVVDSLREAWPKLGGKLAGFDEEDSVLTGIESRSSSPVRILRYPTGETVNDIGLPIAGLYSGGEGAGYAGGIMSAAADGFYLAQSALRRRD
ncbi:MAG: hypothetical protein EOM59_01240 [Clostridia bacterium]|nr:hypothetical protein [Clostridia bacterium]